MSQISIVAYSVTLTETRYLFFLIVSQPDVDMCEFCMAELLLTLISQLRKPIKSQFDDRLIIGYGKMMTSCKMLDKIQSNKCGPSEAYKQFLLLHKAPSLLIFILSNVVSWSSNRSSFSQRRHLNVKPSPATTNSTRRCQHLSTQIILPILWFLPSLVIH